MPPFVAGQKEGGARGRDPATYTYDNAGRLTNLTHKSASGEVIAANSYILDKTGNRLSRSDTRATVSYSYDTIYRLTEALSSTPGNSANASGKGKGIANATQQQKEFYTYDPVGNRLSSEKTPRYTYSVANQLLTNGGSYRYDNNGNLIEKTTSEGITTYAWDYENRLVKVAMPNGSIVEFKYDPLGRRIEKAATETGTTIVTRYVYDNEDIILEYDGSGNVGNKYVHGPGIDEPLAVTQAKETYFYHADGLGSVVALTDKAGKVVQDYQYDSFGNLKDLKNRIKQPYTYTGREFDRETGLYYYRARYYDAAAGRFVSKDPIGFEGGMNFYPYSSNNPINWIDPFGLRPGDVFSTVELAVTNALMYATQRSNAEGVEYGGWISLTNDCKFTYNEPTKGTRREIPNFPSEPPNSADAWYHTHLPVNWFDENFAGANPRNFSNADKQLSNRTNSTGYLGYGGMIYIYHPR